MKYLGTFLAVITALVGISIVAAQDSKVPVFAVSQDCENGFILARAEFHNDLENVDKTFSPTFELLEVGNEDPIDEATTSQITLLPGESASATHLFLKVFDREVELIVKVGDLSTPVFKPCALASSTTGPSPVPTATPTTPSPVPTAPMIGPATQTPRLEPTVAPTPASLPKAGGLPTSQEGKEQWGLLIGGGGLVVLALLMWWELKS